LNYWALNKLNYTEHNPSVTIYYDQTELEDVVDWVNENQKIVGGISFFPRSDHKYDNAPLEEISAEDYDRLSQKVNIDWSKFDGMNLTDIDRGTEYACVSGVCDIA